jgi:predicted protein tyrosine phosphatase
MKNIKLKKVYFIDQYHAQQHIPAKSEAIISILSPPNTTRLHEAWDKSKVLTLEFHDEDNHIYGMEEQQFEQMFDQYYRLFSDQDAERIISFVEEIEDKVTTIIVHCHAGISRSAAVAKFIAETYGLYFPETYSLYNKYVYRKLRNKFYNAQYGEIA